MKDLTKAQVLEVFFGTLALVGTLTTLYVIAFLSPEIIEQLGL